MKVMKKVNEHESEFWCGGILVSRLYEIHQGYHGLQTYCSHNGEVPEVQYGDRAHLTKVAIDHLYTFHQKLNRGKKVAQIVETKLWKTRPTK